MSRVLNSTPRSYRCDRGECALFHVERGTNHVAFFHLLALLTVGLAVVVCAAHGTVVGPALTQLVYERVLHELEYPLSILASYSSVEM